MYKWTALKQKICPSCRHYQPAQATCALLASGTPGPNIKELLNGQRCDPERFLRAYTTRYVTAKYGAEFLDIVDGFTKEILSQLRALDHRTLPSDGAVRDLDGLREWLMSFARDRIVEYLEHRFAKPACGLCEHYRHTQPALCRLQQAPNDHGEMQPHPWFAHKLPPDQDPQALDPPCAQFSSALYSAYQRVADPPRRPEPNAHGARNPFDALKPDDLEPMLSSFLERLERRSLRLEYIVRKVFFFGMSPDDVAKELGTHGWVIRRELDLGFDALQQLIKQCKLDDPGRPPGG